VKKGANSTGEVNAYLKERLVICKQEDTDGRAMGDNRRGQSNYVKFNNLD